MVLLDSLKDKEDESPHAAETKKSKEDNSSEVADKTAASSEIEEDKEPDALLIETGNILTDLMVLGNLPNGKLQHAKRQ